MKNLIPPPSAPFTVEQLSRQVYELRVLVLELYDLLKAEHGVSHDYEESIQKLLLSNKHSDGTRI